MPTIRVDLDTPYDIHVDVGALSTVGEVVRATTDARRVLLVTQSPIARHHLDVVDAALVEAGLDVTVVQVVDGEQAKSVDVLASLWDAAADVPLERRDAVVALGGGVVGDLAGFVAATYNRGISVVQVPTTLLAMVDAAIGGKTAIDIAAGKNLVGAFHQPAAVVVDPAVLSTLGERAYREGFGEVVKYGLIRLPDLLHVLEDPGPLVARDLDVLTPLVQRSAAAKAAVVAADEHEAGERAHLNLGHTYAHALETLTGFEEWLHGEAVGVGLLVALRLGELLGHHDDTLRVRTRTILEGLGLPTTAPALDPDEVWSVMGRDKKAVAGVRYVVLEDLAVPVVVRPDRELVEAAVRDVTT